jgi:hypothetical protein
MEKILEVGDLVYIIHKYRNKYMEIKKNKPAKIIEITHSLQYDLFIIQYIKFK